MAQLLSRPLMETGVPPRFRAGVGRFVMTSINENLDAYSDAHLPRDDVDLQFEYVTAYNDSDYRGWWLSNFAHARRMAPEIVHGCGAS
ncbi:hypothetical protein BS47DRAFT_1339047 [Hydnum rufescens UP504]|uniref:Uncharacterized protein n=1 Tax=Hydnum rufescens UP504 TaxID=1448309 RepID=A0A9P6DXU6_9AGAM|nr:hypothetical protein BS47DRAFT_1339047 [Hydnum rufescens UP504]